MTKKRSLNEILSRNDYRNLTPALIERAQDVAVRIRRKMVELDLDDKELEVEYAKKNGVKVNVRVRIESVKSNGCGSYEFLAIRKRYDYCEEWLSLEDIRKGFYYAGDYNAWVEGASCIDALCFLNAAQDIVMQLGEIEDLRIEEIKTVLTKSDIDL